MFRPHPKHSWLPDGDGDLLLRAALGDAPAAAAAWRQWSAGRDLTTTNRGALRMLPLVDTNLKQHGVEAGIGEPAAGQLLPVWLATQSLFHEASRALDALHHARIPTLVLKGAALAVLDYPDPSTRPMADVDIAVPRHEAARAIVLLRECGWTSAHPLPPPALAFQDGASFRNEHGSTVDLHWRILREGRFLGDDDRSLWSDAVPLMFEGVETRSLSAADRLLHVCVHGAHWHLTLPIRWIADAAMIVRRQEQTLDWDRVVDQARTRGLAPSLAAALDYLRVRFHVSVPVAVVHALRQTHTPRLTRVTHRLRTGREGAYVAGMQNWAAGWRIYGDMPVHRKLDAFLTWFCAVRGIEHKWQVPSWMVSTGVRLSARVVATTAERVVRAATSLTSE